MANNTNVKKERTLVIIKPDGIERSLIGEIIHRIERTGLKLVAMKFIYATEEQFLKHYNKNEAWYEAKGKNTIDNRQANGLPIEKPAIEYGKDIIRTLIKFMTATPIIIMVWEGNKAVGVVKKLVGGTEPLSSDVGTIRGDLTIDSYDLSNLDERAVRNLVHCSDDPNEAEREINVWFNNDEILNYRLINEEIIYNVNLDNLRE
ncbi:MAG TPA: nucleoside-diphosphate kinase [Candidatus Paceibacterota bacterium]|nr:nucleoside-diphosphate kinase [Candidatus Pacearchaeota archaeon]HPC30479.1 nucleoside-diphosphate kinase [Candidatus Pacearchaeota archaeon]HQK58372.1 nucleoside-diphosphate kinase [Candidatus Pacearchaeota archaeon]HRR94701.1 nucleoside-diphosphate kinase [Candidatus Paceibacterota bacterium]HRU20801.1 nucleoside-diphosphate kinase [Candidatus Paceibacterota bacterium]